MTTGIVSSIPPGVEHRVDLESCTSCGHRMELDAWFKSAVKFVCDEVGGKCGSAAIISECPECGKKSWVHWDLISIAHDDLFPRLWRDRAKALHDERHIATVRTWSQGLCWQCNNLQSAKIDTHAWRICTVGCGPTVLDCSSFVRDDAGITKALKLLEERR